MKRICQLLLFVSILCGCTTPESRTEVYSILYDITDPLLVAPDVGELAQVMDIADPDKTIIIRYANLTDVDYNKVRELVRPQRQTGLLANEVSEKKKQRQFEKEIGILFGERDSLEPASHSSVFLPIVRELQYLASLPREHTKQVIIYSNLMENSDLISFYQPQGIYLLDNHPEILLERYMEKTKGLPPISKIHVQVIFIPRDQSENARFRKIAGLYQKVFDQINIPIVFSANPTNAPRPL
ncbi:MAG TPA: hypothetical protein DCX41_05160 [Aequorivita sp.]|nr:hypothetical protein [Pusillimonas sp.]HAV54307.1 hypothetical protein [Aequorivita sp.]|tara:strand:+ start:13119 stop:13841 length:723 start_codon:yes stop_codon:yes gene_type:complete